MAGADIRRFSRDQRGLTLNVPLGVASGALLSLVDALLSPILLLPIFVAQMTDSLRLIGLVSAATVVPWTIGQLIAAPVVRGRRALPWAIVASLIRVMALAALAAAASRVEHVGDDAFLPSFFLSYAGGMFAAGFAQVGATDVAVKSIPRDHGPWFFWLRGLWGGLLALVAAVVARALFRADGPAFPRNFMLLFFAATTVLLTATFLQAISREPRRAHGVRQPALADAIRGVAALGDGNYSRFLAFRGLLALAAVADPFYIIYALRELNVPLRMLGIYLAVLIVTRLAASVIWRPLRSGRGDKSTLQFVAFVRLLIPVVVLTLPYLADTSIYHERITDPTVLYSAFALVFAAYGLAVGGEAAGSFAYMLQVAPASGRPAYVGFTNLVLAAVAFIPVAGGEIIDRYGYQVLFLTAVVLGLAAVFVSGALTETQTQSRVLASAWRLRRARP